ncbi:hypothetical protein QNM99_20935 [Pseudomonas sp. PCH446]
MDITTLGTIIGADPVAGPGNRADPGARLANSGSRRSTTWASPPIIMQ